MSMRNGVSLQVCWHPVSVSCSEAVSGSVKDILPSAVSNQEQSHILSCFFLLHMSAFGIVLASSGRGAAPVALHYRWLCVLLSELTSYQSHLCLISVHKSQPHKVVRPQQKRKFLKCTAEGQNQTSWNASRQAIKKNSVTVLYIYAVYQQSEKTPCFWTGWLKFSGISQTTR